MKTYAVFFIMAFMAMVWYGMLNFATMASAWFFTLLLLSIPWVGMAVIWCLGSDKYKDGWHAGCAYGEIKGRQEAINACACEEKPKDQV